jgi:hypothetical protein
MSAWKYRLGKAFRDGIKAGIVAAGAAFNGAVSGSSVACWG